MFRWRSTKWLRLKNKEFVDDLAKEIFGSKLAMGKHYRLCRAKWDGWLYYLKEHGFARCMGIKVIFGFARDISIFLFCLSPRISGAIIYRQKAQHPQRGYNFIMAHTPYANTKIGGDASAPAYALLSDQEKERCTAPALTLNMAIAMQKAEAISKLNDFDKKARSDRSKSTYFWAHRMFTNS